MQGRPRYWMTRLYIASSILVSCIITWSEPLSLSHRAVSRGAPWGWAWMAFLATLALLALADVIVNDLMPPRFDMPTVLRLRGLLLMALALGLVSQSIVISKYVNGFSSAMGYYWLNAAFAVTTAFLDTFYRHREGRCT